MECLLQQKRNLILKFYFIFVKIKTVAINYITTTLNRKKLGISQQLSSNWCHTDLNGVNRMAIEFEINIVFI